MRRAADGTYEWVASDWWKRLQARKGGSARLNVALVKIGSTHSLHYEAAIQFVNHLIRNGDHAAAWASTVPQIRHRVGITGIHVTEARKSVKAVLNASESRAEADLRAVRRILAQQGDPAKKIKTLIALVGTEDPGD